MKKSILFVFCSICLVVVFANNRLTNLPLPIEESKEEIQVFPNPATHFFSISDQSNLIKRIVVFNQPGRKVKTFTTSNTSEKFPVSDLPKGLYLVQLQDQAGNVVVTRRLFKQ